MKFSHDCVSKFTFIGRYKVANVSGRLLVPVVKPPGVYQRFWNPAYMVSRVFGFHPCNLGEE